nr:CbrC family protein [Burkholderia cepacia]
MPLPTVHRRRFGAAFTDTYGIGGGEWDEVPDAVVSEIACRTPGFQGWQQERWWTHCGDAAQFVGRAGAGELRALGPQAVASIRESTGLDEGAEWEHFLAALDKDGSPTAYMFRCIRCGEPGGYQDCV